MPSKKYTKIKRNSRVLSRIRFILDRDLTIGNLIHKVNKSHGDIPLFNIDFELGYGDLKREITGGDFHNFSNHFRSILEEEFNLQRYDRVAIAKSNSPEYFFLGYSIMYSGGIVVPINGGMNTENIVHYLSYTSARLLITDVATYQRLERSLSQVECLEGIIIADNAPMINRPQIPHIKVAEIHDLFAQVPVKYFDPIPMNNDDICLICHTSGTTGFPKGVVHTNGTLTAGLRRQLIVEPITSKDRAMSASPFNHFINYTGLMSAMLANIQTWLVTKDSAESILALIDDEKITVVFCFPHTYLSIYERGLVGYKLDSVRLWLAGADSSHEAHVAPFLEKGAFLRVFGKKIIPSIYADTYGSSEVGFAALFRFATRHSSLFGRYIGKPSCVGPKIKVVDENGRKVLAGEPGRIVMKGPTVFKGYWNDMEKTQTTVQDGWLWPGDIGYCDLRGRFFHLDRVTDVIHKGNQNIFSLPIEEIILNFPEVIETVVVEKKIVIDENGEYSQNSVKNLIVAFIQFNNFCHEKEDRLNVAYAINEKLSEHEKIDEFYSVSDDQIPRGLTGKVLKRLIRERLQNGEYDSYRQFTKKESTDEQRVLPLTSTQ